MSTFPEKLAAAHPILNDIRFYVGILQEAMMTLRHQEDDDLIERVDWCGNKIGALLDSYIECGLGEAR